MTPLKSLLAATWIAVTGLTAAQINVYLGTVSLLIGIGYQLWKWRREARKAHRDDHPLD